ncbi:MAG: TonB-dependent copper receptor [Rhodospirillaceae bacterium]|nr:MAG: TonB-dependent copper receptor [Rhodospirillaceae bacterium]
MLTKFLSAGKTRAALSTLLLSSTTLISPAFAQDAQAPMVLEGIVIEGKSLPVIINTELNRTDIAPAADVGDFLRSIPGVDAVRMSGHGLDPVIRGQQQNQLNVISDGAYMFGGCPSRMDPPASLTSIDSYDSVTVEKGFQSVRHGPGGTGGTILLERKRPALDDQKPYQVKFGIGGNSNDSAYTSNLDAAYKLGEGYAKVSGTKSHAANYSDGSGKEVRSAFNQWSSGLELGWTPNDRTELTVGYEHDNTTDVLFAGAGMDSPEATTNVFRLKFKKDIEGNTLKTLRFNAYDSRVDHLMDNYSLRAVGAMTMKTPSSSNTQGFKVEGDVNISSLPVLLGLDYKGLDRTAIRYRGTLPANTGLTQSYIWPGVESREIGLFGETTYALDEKSSVKFGLRYDNVNVTAGKTNIVADVAGGVANDRSANQLYRKYYGYEFAEVTEHNISGLMRFEQKYSKDTSSYLTVSRSVRTADTTERTIAADNMVATNRIVGNVRLNPEKHYQIDAGMNTNLAGYDVSVSAYYDRINDYIFRDVARGQSGLLLNDTAVVFRNIDANLMGFDFSANKTFANKVSMVSSLTFTRGDNKDTNGALAQIPPLKMTMDVSYPTNGWLIGVRGSASMKQTRVDDDTATGSGRDVGQTAGYVTADLYGASSLTDNLELGLGVTNMFDTTYASHLNKGNSFDATETQVNEPGRAFYIRLTGTF